MKKIIKWLLLISIMLFALVLGYISFELIHPRVCTYYYTTKDGEHGTAKDCIYVQGRDDYCYINVKTAVVVESFNEICERK